MNQCVGFRIKVRRQRFQADDENVIVTSERATVGNLSAGVFYDISVSTLSRTQPGNNVFENLENVPVALIQTGRPT